MQEAMTTARLIEPAASGPDTERVSVTVPRVEVEEALRAEEPPDLMLDVARPSGAETTDWETTTLTVRLDEAELQHLLEKTDGGDIALGFDRDELAALLEEDVEAHGLREKAAVLTVVAATAIGTGAGVASAMPADPGGGGGGSTPAVTAGGPGGAVAAAGQQSPAATTGGAVPSSSEAVGGAAAAAGTESPAVTMGGATPSSQETIGGAVAAAGDESPAAAMGGAGLSQETIGGAAAAAGDVSPAQATGGAVSPSTEPFGAVAASGGASPAEATGQIGDVPVPTATGADSGFTMPDTAMTALAAAGAALLITGASFVAVRRRVGTRPA